MPRTYVQRARAEAAERTRVQILEAARTSLLESERLEFSVGEVAAAAGVARSTIYATFTSRAGLLSALSDDVLHRAGLDAVIDAFRLPDPRQALEQSLAASCRMYAREHRLFRRLGLLGEVDPEAAVPMARTRADHAFGMASLAQRLHAAGQLRPDLEPARAADILALITSFAAFDELVSRRGLTADAATDALLDLARQSVLGP
jgi:AcrR family transcriptional regulator